MCAYSLQAWLTRQAAMAGSVPSLDGSPTLSGKLGDAAQSPLFPAASADSPLRFLDDPARLRVAFGVTLGLLALVLLLVAGYGLVSAIQSRRRQPRAQVYNPLFDGDKMTEATPYTDPHRPYDLPASPKPAASNTV